ncbi:hypothetical protein CSC2_26740 [Clostridium zeae]|uniref:Uncharacterized protein n=1 Tax=Clostridium zeae TaxID=2759022 RepID=A0ABQ1ECC2_9CLOT|nr:hypothetical protein [Clostridium zeae]GFZ32148.1 hypothetical protein CSC2_26740 [Clostridium zeae]
MLNVVKMNSTIAEKIEIDPYVPVKIRWGQWNLVKEPTIYWRTGDFKNSLIEIGIASKSGVIRSFTIVHSKDIFLDSTHIEFTKSYVEGTPMFDLSNWPESGRLDESGIVEIHYNEGELTVILSKNTVTTKIVSGRIYFGLDTNSNVCAIGICEFSDMEKVQISDTLKYMKDQNKV